MESENNSTISFQHSEKDLNVSFCLLSKGNGQFLFEIQVSSKKLVANRNSKFKQDDLEIMQYVFNRIYTNPHITHHEKIKSIDGFSEIKITNDDYGHVFFLLKMSDKSSNSVSVEIKSELASLPNMIGDILKCLRIEDQNCMPKKTFNDIKHENLALSIEEYTYEKDPLQRDYHFTLFFESSFVSFSSAFTLFDFEYSNLINMIKDPDSNLIRIRPIDGPSFIDITFQKEAQHTLFSVNCEEEDINICAHSYLSMNIYEKIEKSVINPNQIKLFLRDNNLLERVTNNNPS